MKPVKMWAVVRPCRHTHQDTGRFLTAFAWASKPEEVGYCWDCGSLKRDRQHWQYTSKEERIRKAFRAEVSKKKRRKSLEAGRG